MRTGSLTLAAFVAPAITRTVAVLLLGLVATGSAAAQPVSRLTDLETRLHRDQTVYVFHGDGERTEGRFVGVTEEGLVIAVEQRMQAIPEAVILRIDKRDSLLNGAVIGAAVLGLPAAAGAGASCSPDCGRAVTLAGLAFGAIGAGVGALIDRTITGYSPVYVAGPRGTAAAPPRANALEPSARPSDSGTAPAPSLADLGPRIRPRDKMEVVTRGGSTTGLYIRSSRESIALLVDGVAHEVPASDVRRVSRMGHHARRGAMIGLLAGAGAGAIGLAASGEGGFAVGPVFGGVVWGGVIGWMVPSRTVVYDSTGSTERARVQIVPVIAPRQMGVMLAVAF
jgi:hypothetical protein